MKTIALSLFCALAAVLGTDVYITTKHDAQVIAAKVQAYSAGRDEAINDMTGATGPTSAPTAELCTAWWFGTNNKAQAMSQACKNFNSTTTPQKVATQ